MKKARSLSRITKIINNRFFRMVLANPLNLLYILIWNIKMLILKINGNKTINFNVQFDYFYNVFQPIYEELLSDKHIKIYFSWSCTNNTLKDFLKDKIEKNKLISNQISPFIYFDVFITAEINGPDFPLSFFPTRKIELYHGTGIHAQYEKREILSRFDIHFAIGPRYIPFILSLPYTRFLGDNLRKIGYPKLDTLFTPDPDFDGKLIELYGLKDKFVILYTPHWNLLGSLHILGLKMIEKLAAIDKDVVILFKVHNYLFTKFKEQNWYKKLDDLQKNYSNIRIVTRPNTQEIFFLGDMMITDTATTVALEFSITRKPLFVFYSLEWFENKTNVQVEHDIIDVAITFKTIDEITRFTREVKDKNPDMMKVLESQRERQDILINNNLFNPGTATKIACQVIRKELRMQ